MTIWSNCPVPAARPGGTETTIIAPAMRQISAKMESLRTAEAEASLAPDPHLSVCLFNRNFIASLQLLTSRLGTCRCRSNDDCSLPILNLFHLLGQTHNSLTRTLIA